MVAKQAPVFEKGKLSNLTIIHIELDPDQLHTYIYPWEAPGENFQAVAGNAMAKESSFLLALAILTTGLVTGCAMMWILIRMAWHSAGAYRTGDGRGGAEPVPSALRPSSVGPTT